MLYLTNELTGSLRFALTNKNVLGLHTNVPRVKMRF